MVRAWLRSRNASKLACVPANVGTVLILLTDSSSLEASSTVSNLEDGSEELLSDAKSGSGKIGGTWRMLGSTVI